MDKLLDKIKNLTVNIESSLEKKNDDFILGEFIELFYKHTSGNLFTHFLLIDKLVKKEQKDEILKMHFGVQDGMHNMASLSMKLLENKSEVKAKNVAKYYFRDSDGLPHLINIAKAYFQNGTAKGASMAGKWWFDNFLCVLKDNSARYLKGGKSYGWAKDFNHLDYIELVLEKNKD